MKRAEIRKAAAAYLAERGYPREWFEWPKNKPGWLYLLLPSGVLEAIHLAAPMAKYKFRDRLAHVPRRGPALVYARVTATSWRQPDLETMWARPTDGSRQHVEVRGHMGEAIGPPEQAADKRGRR